MADGLDDVEMLHADSLSCSTNGLCVVRVSNILHNYMQRCTTLLQSSLHNSYPLLSHERSQRIDDEPPIIGCGSAETQLSDPGIWCRQHLLKPLCMTIEACSDDGVQAAGKLGDVNGSSAR